MHASLKYGPMAVLVSVFVSGLNFPIYAASLADARRLAADFAQATRQPQLIGIIHQPQAHPLTSVPQPKAADVSATVCSEPAALRAIEILGRGLNPAYDASVDSARTIVKTSRGCSSRVKEYAVVVISAHIDKAYSGTARAYSDQIKQVCGHDRTCLLAAVSGLAKAIHPAWESTTRILSEAVVDIVRAGPDFGDVKSRAMESLGLHLDPSYAGSFKILNSAILEISGIE